MLLLMVNKLKLSGNCIILETRFKYSPNDTQETRRITIKESVLSHTKSISIKTKVRALRIFVSLSYHVDPNVWPLRKSTEKNYRLLNCGVTVASAASVGPKMSGLVTGNEAIIYLKAST